MPSQPYSPPPLSDQVGDGLEIYIVLAKGRDLQDFEAIRGRDAQLTEEVTGTDEGERIFVFRRDLKKD